MYFVFSHSFSVFLVLLVFFVFFSFLVASFDGLRLLLVASCVHWQINFVSFIKILVRKRRQQKVTLSAHGRHL